MTAISGHSAPEGFRCIQSLTTWPKKKKKNRITNWGFVLSANTVEMFQVTNITPPLSNSTVCTFSKNLTPQSHYNKQIIHARVSFLVSFFHNVNAGVKQSDWSCKARKSTSSLILSDLTVGKM